MSSVKNIHTDLQIQVLPMISIQVFDQEHSNAILIMTSLSCVNVRKKEKDLHSLNLYPQRLVHGTVLSKSLMFLAFMYW